ncbi:MAG: hypothetical protein L3J10_09555 [Sulfurimonas sp.]|nr:hypothetical protein [Sulfurimonas sp.]
MSLQKTKVYKMTKKLLIVLGLTSLLAFTGCGDETQASTSAPTEQVNDGSIRLDKVINFDGLTKAEKSFLNGVGFERDFNEVCLEFGVTIRDIKELLSPYFDASGLSSEDIMNPNGFLQDI